jgi:hypothetical protein
LGFADFDEDGITDVFRSDPTVGEWYWSKSGTEDWRLLQPRRPELAVPVSELRFGYFDNDKKADVFMSGAYAPAGWFVSKGGTSPWEVLNPDESDPITDLAFGDFNGDGFTDAMKADGARWMVSYGASTPWREMRTSCHTLKTLKLGDFDGDGSTDVMRAGIRP